MLDYAHRQLGLLVLSAAALVGSQAAAQSPASAIESQFRAWHSALVARDFATLDAIAAPEFTEVQEDGVAVARGTAIGMPTRSPDYRIEEARIERFSSALHGDTADSEGVVAKRENFSGRVYATRFTVSSNWVLRDGRWLLVKQRLTELK